jgi:hypothetical protein
VSCKRLWQIGMEHAPMGEGGDDGGGYADDDAPLPGEGPPPGAPGGPGGPGGICAWFREDGSQVPLRAGATGIWVTVFGEGGAAGQVLVSISRVQREMPPAGGGGGGGEGGGATSGSLKVSSCQAYDFLLMAALRAQARSQAGAGSAEGAGHDRAATRRAACQASLSGACVWCACARDVHL